MKLPRIKEKASGFEIALAFNEAMDKLEDSLSDLILWTANQREFNDNTVQEIASILKEIRTIKKRHTPINERR